MFAVIDDQQQMALLEVLDEDFEDCSLRRLMQTQYRRDFVGNEVRVLERSKIDEPDSSGIRLDEARGHGKSDPSLADAACADYRDKPAPLQQRFDCVGVFDAADECAHWLRQVVARRGD